MEKKRILVVDDEAGFTRLLKLALRTYEIREENDPTRALQAALEAGSFYSRHNPSVLINMDPHNRRGCICCQAYYPFVGSLGL